MSSNIYKCKFCNKIFNKGQQLGGHLNNCIKNPDIENIRKIKSEKISKAGIGKVTSEETKKKISESRLKYLRANPNKVPYKLNHSSKISYPEKIFREAIELNNILGCVYQYQFNIYQFDFAFPDIKLDIEIDGSTHNLNKIKLIDKRRDKYSKQNGWYVLRFTAKEVQYNLNDCINRLKQVIEDIKINKYDNLQIINSNINCIDYKEYKLKLIDDLNLLDEKDFNKACELLNKTSKSFMSWLYKNNKVKHKEIIKNKNIINKKIKNQSILNNIELIKNSNIDFSKFGWVQKTSELINILPQKVNIFMKKYMLDFYNEKCFKKKIN